MCCGCWGLLHILYDLQALHTHYTFALLHEAIRVLRAMPTLNRASTDVSGHITVCGDLHGKLDDLLVIFHKVRPRQLIHIFRKGRHANCLLFYTARRALKRSAVQTICQVKPRQQLIMLCDLKPLINSTRPGHDN